VSFYISVNTEDEVLAVVHHYRNFKHSCTSEKYSNIKDVRFIYINNNTKDITFRIKKVCWNSRTIPFEQFVAVNELYILKKWTFKTIEEKLCQLGDTKIINDKGWSYLCCQNHVISERGGKMHLGGSLLKYIKLESGDPVFPEETQNIKYLVECNKEQYEDLIGFKVASNCEKKLYVNINDEEYYACPQKQYITIPYENYKLLTFENKKRLTTIATNKGDLDVEFNEDSISIGGYIIKQSEIDVLLSKYKEFCD